MYRSVILINTNGQMHFYLLARDIMYKNRFLKFAIKIFYMKCAVVNSLVVKLKAKKPRWKRLSSSLERFADDFLSDCWLPTQTMTRGKAVGNAPQVVLMHLTKTTELGLKSM